MRMILLAASIGIVSVMTTALLAETKPDASGAYAVSSTMKIGGEGRWDYLSVGDNHLLYVTRTTHTQVIDPATGKVVADIAGGGGLHGMALVPSIGRGFVTDGKDAKLLVIDLKANTVLGKIDAADDADGIIYDAGSDRVLVSCGDAGQLLVLDPHAEPSTAKVEKVDLGGKPEFLAADGKGRAYVCINDKNLIAVIDLKTLKVVDRWACGTGTEPTGLAIDPKGGRLFVGCHNQKLVIMSTADGKALGELPIGKGNDACAFDPGTGDAFASCGDGTTTIAHEASTGQFAVKQVIQTRPGARTLAIDPMTHALYLPTADLAPAEAGKRPAPLPNTFSIVVVTAASR